LSPFERYIKEVISGLMNSLLVHNLKDNEWLPLQVFANQ
jgi:hypothetical protein